MKKIISLWFVILSTVFAQSINTQGVLRDANGYALDDGEYNLTFRIYDAGTGGAVKWTDTYSIDVTNGVFNATLGDDSNPVDMLDGDVSYWMSIEVGSDGEMNPRLKLSTSAYEMAYLSGAENVFPGAGNVGIGTTSPGHDVSMAGGLTINGTGATQFTIQKGGSSAFAINVNENTAGEVYLIDRVGGTWNRAITLNNGHVGINNILTPTKPLHIYDDTSSPIRIESSHANNSSAISELNNAPNSTLIFGGLWRDRIFFYWKDDYGNIYYFDPLGSSFSGRSDMEGEGAGTVIEKKVRDQEERIAALEAELAEIKALLQSK